MGHNEPNQVKTNAQKRARIRWFLYLTLINNPTLLKVRMASQQVVLKERSSLCTAEEQPVKN